MTRGAAPGSVNSDTSAPAASAFSLPVTTTAFTVGVGGELDAVRRDLAEHRGGEWIQGWPIEPKERDTVTPFQLDETGQPRYFA